MSKIMEHDHFDRTNSLRKRIQVTKKIILYAIFPAMVGLTVYGVLRQENTWCHIAESCLIVSSSVTLLTFLSGLVLFLLKRWKD